MGLQSRNLQMVPPENEHLKYIYEWECNESERYLWTGHRAMLDKLTSYDRFISRLRNYCYEYFVILKKDTREPVGCIYSYNYNMEDGHLYITLYIDSKHTDFGYGAEAGYLYLSYLFRNLRLIKVFCDVYEYNEKSIRFLESIGFEKEAELKDYKYWNGKMWAMDIYSLSYESFQTSISPVKKYLRVE